MLEVFRPKGDSLMIVRQMTYRIRREDLTVAKFGFRTSSEFIIGFINQIKFMLLPVIKRFSYRPHLKV
jgi:hypothetical protein